MKTEVVTHRKLGKDEFLKLFGITNECLVGLSIEGEMVVVSSSTNLETSKILPGFGYSSRKA